MNAALETANSTPHARLEMVEKHGRARPGVIRCVINHHLAIDAAALSDYCFRALLPRIDDLVLLAASTAFADRTVARRTSLTWGRRLDISVPVLEVDFWRQAKVIRSLHGLLNALTGDEWAFTFRHRRTMTKTQRQPPLSLSHGMAPIVMPFSDGLDSFAGARLVASREPQPPLILVTTGQRGDADYEWRERHLNARRYRFVVPFQFPNRETGHRFREPSYRSRAFVFGAMAGIAAHLSYGERVVFTESGQGALGPWLAPVGNESPDIRMHPIFTRRLAEFLQLVLETPVRFEHPRLWHTKGETLAELVAHGLADDWYQTRSCARDARHMSIGGALKQCGVCAACLLRRQSLLASKLDERLERYSYFWTDLKAHSLNAANQLEGRATTPDDESQAICGFLALEQLAELAESSKQPAYLAALISELAEALEEPPAEVDHKLQRLLVAHRLEWTTFIDQFGELSFLKRWASVRR